MLETSSLPRNSSDQSSVLFFLLPVMPPPDLKKYKPVPYRLHGCHFFKTHLRSSGEIKNKKQEPHNRQKYTIPPTWPFAICHC